jgi:hypothetical protein
VVEGGRRNVDDEESPLDGVVATSLGEGLVEEGAEAEADDFFAAESDCFFA